MAKYLDSTGLTQVWTTAKSIFAAKSHNHDSTYLKLSGGTIYNNSMHSVHTLDTTSGGDDAWNKDGNTMFRLRSNNNLMVFSIGSPSNERTGFIQVGHADSNTYSWVTSALHLNKLGGNVYINNNIAYHAGNLPAYPTKDSWNYDDRYLRLTAGNSCQLTGTLYVPRIAITNTDGYDEITFARGSFNYLRATVTGGKIGFVTDGKDMTGSSVDMAIGNGWVSINNGTSGGTYNLYVNGSLNATSIYLSGTALGTASTHNHGDYALSGHTHSSLNVYSESQSSINDFVGFDTFRYSKRVVDGTADLFLHDAGNNANSVIYIPTSATTWGTQLGFNSNAEMFLRAYSGSSLSGVGWKRVLNSSNFIDYTVTKSGSGASGTWGINISGSAGSASSANKLTTPRTIWGQSFDGSGNVSGSLTGVTTISAKQRYADGILWQEELRNSYNGDIAGYGAGIKFAVSDGTDIETKKWSGIAYIATQGYANYGAMVFYSGSPNETNGEKMRLTGAGNLGLGTTSPQYKLDVNGNIRSNSIVLSSPQGTAPMSITSTTVVEHLNADLLDGNHASAFVTALGTSGNNLTWTKNGSTNSITVPYSDLSGNSYRLGGQYAYAFQLSSFFWHDLLAFNKKTLKFEYSEEGETAFTEGNIDEIANLFDQKDSRYYLTTHKKVRITFRYMAYCSAQYFIFQGAYGGAGWGTETYFIEYSSNNADWTDGPAGTLFCAASWQAVEVGPGSREYMRITFEQTGSGNYVPLLNIKLLTTRLGDQGSQITEYPYTWDNQGRASVYYASSAGGVPSLTNSDIDTIIV